MRKNNRTEKRLRLIPLILGGYGAFLGLGLAAIGLAEMKEGIGIIRFLIGLGMAGFGFLGIWDGVRDLIKPEKKAELPASQFILTDTSGNRSSLVTTELLREQMDILAKSEDYKNFYLQILPPLPSGEYGGMLKQITCIYHFNIILVAFFEMPKDGYQIYQKSMEPDTAVEWLKQLLAGNPDFSEWDNIERKTQREEEAARQEEDDDQWDEADIDSDGADDESNEAETCSDESEVPQEGVEAFWHQLRDNQKGQMFYWHKLLVIYGESWHDEHKFFSARDVELAIEGIHEGKYTKAVLEWGTKAFDLFPGVQNDLMVIWCTNNTGKGDTRFLAREGTVTQVKFWLVNYLDRGCFEEMSGWSDVTARIESITTRMEKEKRKGEKRHG